jgi:hypothetical protein
VVALFPEKADDLPWPGSQESRLHLPVEVVPELDDLVPARLPVTCAGYERRFGDLKLFEPKTMCPIIAVRDREGR